MQINTYFHPTTREWYLKYLYFIAADNIFTATSPQRGEEFKKLCVKVAFALIFADSRSDLALPNYLLLEKNKQVCISLAYSVLYNRPQPRGNEVTQ